MLGEQHTLGLKFETKDIKGTSYYHWDLFCLKKTFIEDELEKDLIRNRMMFVLTGDQKYTRVLQSVGGKQAMSKKKEDVEKRKQGLKRKRG